MGSLKFPHASGNSMSIAAPATNPASDLELKLPATVGTAGQVLSVDGSGNLTWVDQPSGGLSEVDQWRSTSNFSTTKTPIDSGWERNDTTTNGFAAGLPIGTGMSESSGVFTFGATGKYKVEAFINIHHTNASNLV